VRCRFRDEDAESDCRDLPAGRLRLAEGQGHAEGLINGAKARGFEAGHVVRQHLLGQADQGVLTSGPSHPEEVAPLQRSA